MEDNRTLRKWLLRLLIVHIIGLTYSVLTHVVDFGTANDWLKLLFSAGVIFCLFPLGKNHKFYRIAAAILSVDLICSVLRIVLNTHAVIQILYKTFQNDAFQVMVRVNNIFHVILLVCNFGAIFFEFVAHSKVVKTSNLRLSKCWIWLTVAMLTLSVLMNVLGSILVVMLEKETLDIGLYQQIQPFLSLPGILLRILYMVCLFKSGLVLAQAKDPTG